MDRGTWKTTVHGVARHQTPFATCKLLPLAPACCHPVLGATPCVTLSGSLLSFGTVSCIQGSAFRLSCLSVSVLCPSIKDSLSLTKQ